MHRRSCHGRDGEAGAAVAHGDARLPRTVPAASTEP